VVVEVVLVDEVVLDDVEVVVVVDTCVMVVDVPPPPGSGTHAVPTEATIATRAACTLRNTTTSSGLADECRPGRPANQRDLGVSFGGSSNCDLTANTAEHQHRRVVIGRHTPSHPRYPALPAQTNYSAQETTNWLSIATHFVLNYH